MGGDLEEVVKWRRSCRGRDTTSTRVKGLASRTHGVDEM